MFLSFDGPHRRASHNELYLTLFLHFMGPICLWFIWNRTLNYENISTLLKWFPVKQHCLWTRNGAVSGCINCYVIKNYIKEILFPCFCCSGNQTSSRITIMLSCLLLHQTPWIFWQHKNFDYVMCQRHCIQLFDHHQRDKFFNLLNTASEWHVHKHLFVKNDFKKR